MVADTGRLRRIHRDVPVFEATRRLRVSPADGHPASAETAKSKARTYSTDGWFTPSGTEVRLVALRHTELAVVRRYALQGAASDSELVSFCRAAERTLARLQLPPSGSHYTVGALAVAARVYAAECTVDNHGLRPFSSQYVLRLVWSWLDDSELRFIGMDSYVTTERRRRVEIEPAPECTAIRCKARALATALRVSPDLTSSVLRPRRGTGWGG